MKKSVSQSRNSVFGTFTSFSVSPTEHVPLAQSPELGVHDLQGLHHLGLEGALEVLDHLVHGRHVEPPHVDVEPGLHLLRVPGEP